MGKQIYETEKSVNPDEKVDGLKESVCCLPHWWLLSLNLRIREHHSLKEEQKKIKQVHEDANKGLKEVQKSMEGWKVYRAQWQRRGEAWSRGEELSVQDRGRFIFDTNCRYAMTTTTPSSGPEKETKETAVLDFRTPEGRGEALKWYEDRYFSTTHASTDWIEGYDDWERDMKEYIYMRKKRQGGTEQDSLRLVVLKGVPKPVWWVTTSKVLPD